MSVTSVNKLIRHLSQPKKVLCFYLFDFQRSMVYLYTICAINQCQVCGTVQIFCMNCEAMFSGAL
jgi:hypothetical protein